LIQFGYIPLTDSRRTTGITPYLGGALSVLSIAYTLTPLDDPKTRAEAWQKECEEVTAIYKEVITIDE
jgi:hypothetical protein